MNEGSEEVIPPTPSAGTTTATLFPTPSFFSPEPATTTNKDLNKRTLSGGGKKKLQNGSALQGLQQKRKVLRQLETTPLASKNGEQASKETPNLGRTSEISASLFSPDGISEKIQMKKQFDYTIQTPPASSFLKSTTTSGAIDGATRKLLFQSSPAVTSGELSESKKRKRLPNSKKALMEQQQQEEEQDVSSASSDECEVTFDAMTFGNTRIVRESLETPGASTPDGSLENGNGIMEHTFALSSTVSSIAVAPNGEFLVVGFNNGTIYMYPLTDRAKYFRHGILLDHISARGMYTQLMVQVLIPEDGKFIFAGVYRGSTEIRAIEVDSIRLPNMKDLVDPIVASAEIVSHTFSDAKLKGFGDVKRVNDQEYQLLCGLGIKNIHLWRFYQHSKTLKWYWECIMDKQTNGITLEYLAFSSVHTNQFLSKSEHQNVRVWNIKREMKEELTQQEEADENIISMKKINHVDIKNTVDALAVYGEYAYTRGERLALVDLRSSCRFELDLPLSAEEGAALAGASSNKDLMLEFQAEPASMIMPKRASRRGRGAASGAGNSAGGLGDGRRHMRLITQVSGHEKCPFMVGMCSDGSVFVHDVTSDLGIHTPLKYVEGGYEQFFQQTAPANVAMHSDLTRLNTSGLLTLLKKDHRQSPTNSQNQISSPSTDTTVTAVRSNKMDPSHGWLVAAANESQLIVRSLSFFLHRMNPESVLQEEKEKTNKQTRLAAIQTPKRKKQKKDLKGQNKLKHKIKKAEKEKLKLLEYRQQEVNKDDEDDEQEQPEQQPIEPESPVVSVTSCSSPLRSLPPTPKPVTPSSKGSTLSSSAIAVVEALIGLRMDQQPSSSTPAINIKNKEMTKKKRRKKVSTSDTNHLRAPTPHVLAESIDNNSTRVEVSVGRIQPAVEVDGEEDLMEPEPEMEPEPFYPNTSVLSASFLRFDPEDEDDEEDGILKRVEAEVDDMCDVSDVSDVSEDEQVEFSLEDRLLTERMSLLQRFATQYDRVRENYDAEVRRIQLRHKQISSSFCSCQHPSKHTSRASTASSGVKNWKLQLIQEYSKRKKVKREESKRKKACMSEMDSLRIRLRAQVDELLCEQRLEADALVARQQLYMYQSAQGKSLPQMHLEFPYKELFTSS